MTKLNNLHTVDVQLDHATNVLSLLVNGTRVALDELTLTKLRLGLDMQAETARVNAALRSQELAYQHYWATATAGSGQETAAREYAANNAHRF